MKHEPNQIHGSITYHHFKKWMLDRSDMSYCCAAKRLSKILLGQLEVEELGRCAVSGLQYCEGSSSISKNSRQVVWMYRPMIADRNNQSAHLHPQIFCPTISHLPEVFQFNEGRYPLVQEQAFRVKLTNGLIANPVSLFSLSCFI